MTRVHIGAAILTTDCQSENNRTGTLPELSQELLDLIVDFAVADLEDGEGAAARKMMHTSSILRCQAAKAFNPIQLFEEAATLDLEHDRAACFSRSLVNFVWDAVLHWVNDWSLKKHKLVQPTLPSCRDYVTTTRGRQITQASVDVVINDREPENDEGADEEDGEVTESWEGGYYYDFEDGAFQHLDERDIGITLLASLDAACTPRALSPYDRALEDTLDVPGSTVIEIRLTMLLAAAGAVHRTPEESYDVDNAHRVVRSWRFRTSRLQASP